MRYLSSGLETASSGATWPLVPPIRIIVGWQGPLNASHGSPILFTVYHTGREPSAAKGSAILPATDRAAHRQVKSRGSRRRRGPGLVPAGAAFLLRLRAGRPAPPPPGTQSAMPGLSRVGAGLVRSAICSIS